MSPDFLESCVPGTESSSFNKEILSSLATLAFQNSRKLVAQALGAEIEYGVNVWEWGWGGQKEGNKYGAGKEKGMGDKGDFASTSVFAKMMASCHVAHEVQLMPARVGRLSFHLFICECTLPCSRRCSRMDQSLACQLSS